MITELEIDRERWVRDGKDNTFHRVTTTLLNSQDLMCCLGFEALAQGLTEDDIRNRANPCSINAIMPEGYFNLHLKRANADRIANNFATNLAISANDWSSNALITDVNERLPDYLLGFCESRMTEKLREEMLILIFKNEWNITLTFTGPFQKGDSRNEN